MSSARTRSLSFITAFSMGTLVFLSAAQMVYAATYSVSITGTAFVPATLQVVVGDTIDFRNTTTSTQSAKTTVTAGFNTGNIGASQSKSVTVLNAGTYQFTSQYNEALTGTITVASASATTTTATTSTTTTTSTTSATTSGTKTGQPAQTQAQPVTGVFEVFLALVASGMATIGLGWFWQQKMAYADNNPLVNLPTVTLTNHHESSDDTE